MKDKLELLRRAVDIRLEVYREIMSLGDDDIKKQLIEDLRTISHRLNSISIRLKMDELKDILNLLDVSKN